MFICMQKNNFISLTSFTRYCEDIANFLSWEFRECLPIPIKSHCINLKGTFMLICMQKIKEKANLLFWVILACLTTHTWNNSINLKKSLMCIYRQKVGFILHVFLEILQTCYLGCFLNGRLCTLKVILSICRKFWYLFVGKKSNSFPTFLGLMQGYVNFLFWVLWAWLATHTQNDSINL